MKASSPLKKTPKTVKIDLSSQKKHLPTILQTPVNKLKQSKANPNKYSSAKLVNKSKQPKPVTLQSAVNSYNSTQYSNRANHHQSYRQINKPHHYTKKSNQKHTQNSSKSNESAKFNNQFNKSVQKLKHQLFPDEKSQTKARIKTLKAIGEKAYERQRQIEQLKRKRHQNQQHLLKQQQYQKPAHFNYNIVENKPYFQFQKQHKAYLAQRQKARLAGRMPSPNHYPTYSFKTFSFSDEHDDEHDDQHSDKKHDEHQKSNLIQYIQQPTQAQIQCVCQIYAFCSLDSELDTMCLDDLNQLTQQFQRLYFLKVIQSKSNAKPRGQVNSAEIMFYSLIKQFKNNIKVAFYRKEKNNIYDLIYFLKDSKKLQIVCNQFAKIKDMIDM